MVVLITDWAPAKYGARKDREGIKESGFEFDHKHYSNPNE